MGLFGMIPCDLHIKTFATSYTTRGYSFTYRIGGRLEPRNSWDYRLSGLPRENVKQKFMDRYCRETFESRLRERFIIWSWYGGAGPRGLIPQLCVFQPTLRQQLVFDPNTRTLKKDAADTRWHDMGCEFRIVVVEANYLPTHIDYQVGLNRIGEFEWVKERFPALIRSEDEVVEFVNGGGRKMPASARHLLSLIEDARLAPVRRNGIRRKPKALIRETITREIILFGDEESE